MHRHSTKQLCSEPGHRSTLTSNIYLQNGRAERLQHPAHHVEPSQLHEELAWASTKALWSVARLSCHPRHSKFRWTNSPLVLAEYYLFYFLFFFFFGKLPFIPDETNITSYLGWLQSPTYRMTHQTSKACCLTSLAGSKEVVTQPYCSNGNWCSAQKHCETHIQIDNSQVLYHESILAHKKIATSPKKISHSLGSMGPDGQVLCSGFLHDKPSCWREAF